MWRLVGWLVAAVAGIILLLAVDAHNVEQEMDRRWDFCISFGYNEDECASIVLDEQWLRDCGYIPVMII